ncbi:MAG: zf-HC2 domain-containing protein [Thermoanaerobaculia bacterium]
MSSPREMSCLELADAVSAYLERELDPGERVRFDAHFRGCQGCRRLVARSKAVVGAFRGLEDARKEAIASLIAADHDHDGLDAVAGCEYVDDRLRFEE